MNTLKTARDVLRDFVSGRSAVQHEAAVKAFFGKLPFRPATDMYTSDEVMGLLAGLLSLGVQQADGQATHSVLVDELGNRTHRVDLGEQVNVAEGIG